MEEAGHFPGAVIFQGCLLEATDAYHLGEELDFPLWGERLVDRRGSEIQG
jgi:hypothetical protein